MTTLIRRGSVTADPYAAIEDEAPLPSTGPILISLARWQRDGKAIAARGEAFGVRLPNTADVQTLDSGLLSADLIVLEFPGFADGRAYSQARLLREVAGYRGELRATGAAVVRDQLLGMLRCGIDAFALRADQSVEACQQALADFSLAYQPALDALPTVRARRREQRGN